MPTLPMEAALRAIAGSFILISLALAAWASPWWLLFTAFVGVNLIQSAFTGWCLMQDILRKTVYRGAAGGGAGA